MELIYKIKEDISEVRDSLESLDIKISDNRDSSLDGVANSMLDLMNNLRYRVNVIIQRVKGLINDANNLAEKIGGSNKIVIDNLSMIITNLEGYIRIIDIGSSRITDTVNNCPELRSPNPNVERVSLKCKKSIERLWSDMNGSSYSRDQIISCLDIVHQEIIAVENYLISHNY